jgi:hypothetical protein
MRHADAGYESRKGMCAGDGVEAADGVKHSLMLRNVGIHP